MRTNTSHHSTRITPIGLAFVALLGGCDAPGEPFQGETDDPRSAQIEAAEQQTEPNAAIPASPETLALTDGVVSWRVYDEETVRIVGVDADERAIVDLQFQVDQDDSGALLGVAVQMNAPDSGTITFDADGQLRENTLDGAHGRLFEALVADFQAVEAGSEVEPRWVSCAVASAKLLLACGPAVVTCVHTFGLGCALGGAKCIAAALDWLCACKGESC